MSNVVEMGGTTSPDIPVDRMLNNIKPLSYSQIVVVGLKDGEYILHGSTGDKAEILLALEMAKKFILDSVRG